MQDNFPNYYKIIADNIKSLRVAQGLSQDCFAEKIGCSREYVSRLENYHEQISLQMLLNIAKCFGKKPQSFFE